MTQSEQFFLECMEAPDGIYPTVEDYSLALAELHKDDKPSMIQVAQAPGLLWRNTVGIFHSCSEDKINHTP